MGNRICSIEGCDKALVAKDRCGGHYSAWRRANPKYKPRPSDPIERYWSYVDRSDPDGCWPWTGTLDEDGYGQFWAGGRKGKWHRAHRWGYSNIIGPIPHDKPIILHVCDLPSCNRPSHWLPGTNMDNTMDMMSKGRCNPPSGERSASAKLTWDDVRYIRKRYAAGGIRLKDLGQQYGVAHTAIWKIVNNVHWKEPV